MKFDPFSNPKVLKVGNILFYLLLFGTLLADPFVTRHEGFSFESNYGFFATFGFVACVFVIYGARLLRFFTKKKEDYYDK
jgi:prolipoprotein diacylglyceryltransferase